MTTAPLLQRFNTGLHEIREVFHKDGRLDDSNAKLDEIAKLLFLEVAAAYEPRSGMPTLSALIHSKSGAEGIVKALNNALGRAAGLKIFRNKDGESLLGANPRMALAESEGKLAIKLVTLVTETFGGSLKKPESSKTFEAINEAFGHFVRDNFRNNIEDAQYMTPPEVIDFACELAIKDALRIAKATAGTIVVCDPSCGVGSFLAQFYRVWLRAHKAESIQLVGQDKVDRMARLAKLNMLLFGAQTADITRGNSILTGSELDKYRAGCDIIVTNPPFGARFHTKELAEHSAKNFPCLHDFIQSSDSYIDSELLFIDRYVSLLKPGGVAYTIVPDAVVSSSGLPGQVRDYLRKSCSIISITELPAVTFAQAGTRTKTCLLHFQKTPPSAHNRVFFSNAKSLGFEVASRKGVPYKKPTGENELPAIRAAMAGKAGRAPVSILSTTPSCVSAPYATLNDSPWTPSHHSAERYATLDTLKARITKGGLELKRLHEIVTLPNALSRRVKHTTGAKCISILHIGDFGSLNIRELMGYSPKYPGQPCSPGDILFSKINPRIPRAIVVPDLGIPLTCSSEFEVMRPVTPYSAHEIMLLLLSANAQSQILSLTSGTSSSHNRIKTEQLMEVQLPVLSGKRRKAGKYESLVCGFAAAHIASIKAGKQLNDTWAKMNELLRG